MSRFTELQNSVQATGLSIDTYSPGDGVTRYRFFNEYNGNYFASSGIFTALGIRDAEIFWKGYLSADEADYDR